MLRRHLSGLLTYPLMITVEICFLRVFNGLAHFKAVSFALKENSIYRDIGKHLNLNSKIY